MKRYLIVSIMMLLLLNYSTGCTQKNTDKTIFTAVEIPPQPEGGIAAFAKYIGKNLNFPKSCKSSKVFGKIHIEFIVAEDGNLTNPKILYPEEICPEFKEHIVKLIENAPVWTPGKMGGKNVRVRYTLPIHIHINLQD